MEWQPIDTAPRDFSVVVIYEEGVDRNKEVGEAYFAPIEYDGDDVWHWSDNNSCAFPTHWMPVPDPPQ